MQESKGALFQRWIDYFIYRVSVHLGAMQHTVRYQMDTLKDDLHRGDVILANHPKAGLALII